jgi:hypothetical protein
VEGCPSPIVCENELLFYFKPKFMKKFNSLFQDEAVKDSALVAVILAAIAAVALFLI